MRINLKKLLAAIAIPLIIGGISAFITMGSMEDFESLNKPPLTPSGWLFPVVWSVLFILMGIASYIVYDKNVPVKSKNALTFYAVQLVFNFFWSIFFFSLNAYLFSFIWLIILWVLIIITACKFYKISKTAGYLLIPYIIWVTFAGYLNLAIYLLN